MSEKITLSFPVTILEELHCFICKGYLSCSPVLLLANGNYICGRCSPSNTDAPIHRLVPFEALLSKMSFPCIFKKYGCPKLLLFGKAAKHESKCVQKPRGCPTNTSTTCPWEGNMTQLFQHFEKDHPAFVKDKTEFQLELSKDAQGFLMTFVKPLPFIIKYVYKANERILQYDVRCCDSRNGHGVTWKMQLINNANSECSFNLKPNDCLSYNESFYDLQNAKVLDISKFLECLGDPDCIVVAFNLKITKSDHNNVTAEGNNCKGDSGIIKDLKCYACGNYLVPPLFDLNGKTVCYDCSETNATCKPSNDKNLLKLVNEAVYPCRWRECNFVGKSNIYKDHQMKCEFRMYSCLYTDCNISFKLNEAIHHLKSHAGEYKHIVYIPNKIIYKTSFSKNNYNRKDILTIKNKNIILLVHEMVVTNSECSHNINVYGSGFNTFTGTVHFEHKHCKLSSKQFNINSANMLSVDFKELPSCFKNTDVLTVIVELVV